VDDDKLRIINSISQEWNAMVIKPLLMPFDLAQFAQGLADYNQ